ncbi:AAA family ATPase [Algicella marina]|nr:AAA family ATPase [Algicella marina]
MGWVLHLGGYPGVGKLTVARALAARTGARLLDNQTLLNPASALFDRGDAAHARLRRTVRDAVFAAAGEMGSETRLILTDALSEEQEALFADVAALAARLGVPLHAGILEVGRAEHAIRVAAAERKGLRKLTDAAIALHLRETVALLVPQGARRFDGEGRSPDTVAGEIAGAFDLG